jgi:integrase
LKVAMKWEESALARATESQIRRVLSDIHVIVHGRPLASATVRDYAAQWLARKQGETSKSTLSAYKRAVEDMLEFLGERQGADLASVTPAEMAALRDRWAAVGSPKTVNNKLKAVRVLFQTAWRDGVISENPAAKVQTLRSDASNRRAFSLAEIKTVLRVADGEWRGLILAGVYTGQRLGDLARLRWNQLDLERRELALTTTKTRRRIILPIAGPLHEWLLGVAGDDATGPVFPGVCGKAERGGTSPLSQEFHSLLVLAGLATARTAKERGELRTEKRGTGKGRRAPRPRHELSFHSLRHTATSWLKMAGVSEAVARDIIGHESAEVSRHYTHVDEASKRDAMDRLPQLS